MLDTNLKYVSLVVLVVQNSALILMMRYTRAGVSSDQLYLASTAVLMSEIVKTLVCLYVVYTLLPTRSLSKLVDFLYRQLVVQWRETIKLALPAVLYLIQVKKKGRDKGVLIIMSNSITFVEQLAIYSSNEFRCGDVPSDLSVQDFNHSLL
jgi:hypothetical protein